MFDRKPLELPPLIVTPPRRLPEKCHLVHYTEQNYQKFGHGAAYIDLLAANVDTARKTLIDTPFVLAEDQDRDELQSLYDGLQKLLAREVQGLAYLVPERRSVSPYNYPPIRGSNESGVRLWTYEQAMHEAKCGGFEKPLKELFFIRYPKQSRKALDGLLKLIIAEDAEYQDRWNPVRAPDNRPSQGLVPDPRAPKPAPEVV